ncbi:MAG: hypothetical protein AABY32_01705 [Nanoarchaeota archaeon]
MWTISRQHRWQDGLFIVEISYGNISLCNPNAYSPNYSGELEEFLNPIEAVNTAWDIAIQWQKDTNKIIYIAKGYTAGSTMHFDEMELTEENKQYLLKWANEIYENLDKCEHCGEVINKKNCYKNYDYDDLYFCSDNCCSIWIEKEEKFLAEQV